MGGWRFEVRMGWMVVVIVNVIVIVIGWEGRKNMRTVVSTSKGEHDVILID